jgi:hypothetical protein
MPPLVPAALGAVVGFLIAWMMKSVGMDDDSVPVPVQIGEQDGACVVTSIPEVVIVVRRRKKKIEWHVDNACPSEQCVTIGNFTRIEGGAEIPVRPASRTKIIDAEETERFTFTAKEEVLKGEWKYDVTVGTWTLDPRIRFD